MRAWALRIIGLLNILFAIFALLFEGVALLSGGKFPTKVTPTPMDWIIFALLLAVSNYLVVHPALYGIRLIRKDESALLPCALLFAAQTLVFTLGVYIMLYWRSMLEIVTGLWVFAVLPIQFSVARITANPDRTPKKGYCPDCPPLDPNPISFGGANVCMQSRE
jgi:hypothetical protein